MALVAASFCNQNAERPNLLAIVDTRSGEYRTVSFGIEALNSACGLAFDGTYLYCACGDGERSYLAILTESGSHVHDLSPLPGVVDVHSICLDGTGLIAVSTGTDEVVRVELGGSECSAEVLWRASATRSDTHHLNAVLRTGDALFCSGFGVKDGPAWSDARRGYVYDISQSRYVARGLYHPHSIAIFGDEMYVCESSRVAYAGTNRRDSRWICPGARI